MKNKKLFIYTSIYMISMMVMIVIFINMFDIEALGTDMIIKKNSIEKATSIIINNLKNFICYIVFFPIYVFMIAMDILQTSWAIAASFKICGWTNTIDGLMPHAIIEIPIHILYKYISSQLFCKLFIKKKDILKVYSESIKNYYKYYIFCFWGIVLSGFVEGMIS